MSISIRLPQFLTSQVVEDIENDCLQMDAGSLSDIFNLFNTKYPKISHKIFKQDGDLHRNVIVVINDNLVSAQKMNTMHLNSGDTLEFMFQFAGG